MTPTKVGDIDGFVGTFSFEVGNSQPNRVTHVVWWERDGLAFQLSGTQLSEAETLAAAASTEPASDKKWSELLHATGADSNGSMIGPLPRPADQELACCNPPNVVTADPNAASLRVSRSNGDRYTIALHDLPGADDLRIAVVGVLDGVQPMELLDAAGNVLQTL